MVEVPGLPADSFNDMGYCSILVSVVFKLGQIYIHTWCNFSYGINTIAKDNLFLQLKNHYLVLYLCQGNHPILILPLFILFLPLLDSIAQVLMECCGY